MGFKESLSKIGKGIKDGADKVGSKAQETVEITKLNLSINGEEGKIKSSKTSIGDIIYNHYLEKSLELPQEIVDICVNIDENNKTIEELREKIASIKSSDDDKNDDQKDVVVE